MGREQITKEELSTNWEQRHGGMACLKEGRHMGWLRKEAGAKWEGQAGGAGR